MKHQIPSTSGIRPVIPVHELLLFESHINQIKLIPVKIPLHTNLSPLYKLLKYERRAFSLSIKLINTSKHIFWTSSDVSSISVVILPSVGFINKSLIRLTNMNLSCSGIGETLVRRYLYSCFCHNFKAKHSVIFGSTVESPVTNCRAETGRILRLPLPPGEIK